MERFPKSAAVTTDEHGEPRASLTDGMSTARVAAIEKMIADPKSKVQSVQHALFLERAGSIELPA